MFQSLVFYDRINRVPSDQEIKKQEVIEEIKKVHAESVEIYASPKITVMIARIGLAVSQKTVGNYMQKIGLRLDTYVNQDTSQLLRVSTRNRAIFLFEISTLPHQTKCGVPI